MPILLVLWDRRLQYAKRMEALQSIFQDLFMIKRSRVPKYAGKSRP